VTSTSIGEGSDVAHSLQYLESEGLSVWHFGHLLAIDVPLFSQSRSAKEYQEMQAGVKYHFMKIAIEI